jgi:hypothetical protein
MFADRFGGLKAILHAFSNRWSFQIISSKE